MPSGAKPSTPGDFGEFELRLLGSAAATAVPLEMQKRLEQEATRTGPSFEQLTQGDFLLVSL